MLHVLNMSVSFASVFPPEQSSFVVLEIRDGLFSESTEFVLISVWEKEVLWNLSQDPDCRDNAALNDRSMQ